jgi:hypothetical protein
MAAFERPRWLSAGLAAGIMVELILLAGTAFADEFASSGRTCGYPGLRYDMSKVEAAARQYPNGRILILTPQEKAELQDQLAEWNRNGGRPMREMAPCFNCSQQFEACIVFERGGGVPPGDEFSSNGGPPPPGDDFGSNGGPGPKPGDSDACRKSPQSYTCLYGHPDDGGVPVLPPNATYGCPDFHDMDVPGAAPAMRYQVGFTQGVRQCVGDQATAQNVVLAALATKYREIAILLQIAAAPGAIDAVLHPPGVARNPNPYLQGREEGKRLCEWGLKVSPVLVARCRTQPSPKTPPVKAPPVKAKCSASEAASGYGNAAAAANAHAPVRVDCFECSVAWVLDEAYAAPAGGGRLADLIADIVPSLRARFGNAQLQGPPLPCWRQGAQAKGYPGSMSIPAIEGEMRAAGDGAKGLVFWKGAGNDPGHVIGVKTVGNEVIFWDPQQRMDGRLWFPTLQGQWITFFRIQ